MQYSRPGSDSGILGYPGRDQYLICRDTTPVGLQFDSVFVNQFGTACKISTSEF